MDCPRCGKLLRPEARFCGDCGLELEPRHPSWESGSVYAQPSDTVVLFQEEEAPSDTVVLFLLLTCLPLAPLSALPDHGSDPGLGPGEEQPVEYMAGGVAIQVGKPRGAFYSSTLSVDPSGSIYSEQQTELTGAFHNKLLGAFGAELLYVGPAVAYAWRRFLPDLLPEETLS